VVHEQRDKGYIIRTTFYIGGALPAGLVPINGATRVSNTWVIYDFK